MTKVGIAMALLLVVLIGIISVNHNSNQNPEITFAAEATTSTPVVQEIPPSTNEPTYNEYVVKKGDILSILSAKKWETIAKDNDLQNPDLIYPGQKLKVRKDIKLQTAKKVHATNMVSYCNIGADPVDLHRELSALEREYSLEDDVLVRMGTGSDKEVKCILKKDEVVVIDENNEAKWVRKYGNPILNKIIVATVKPIQHQHIQATDEQRKQEVRTRGPIILGIYENPNARKISNVDNQ
ncbi:MAG: LysM peptidoglycan-binding domain-containing protein [bacterium]|nr:LysM peptidoglycan-binding domain-containing protein [bacterium]